MKNDELFKCYSMFSLAQIRAGCKDKSYENPCAGSLLLPFFALVRHFVFGPLAAQAAVADSQGLGGALEIL